jgi:hypothetical protein
LEMCSDIMVSLFMAFDVIIISIPVGSRLQTSRGIE